MGEIGENNRDAPSLLLLIKIRTLFFDNLLPTIQNENLDEKENIIMGGDFNCPLNTLLDKKGEIMIPRKSDVASIGCFQSELELVDIWRVENPWNGRNLVLIFYRLFLQQNVKNPSTKKYTWSQISPNIFCRLDYWLISNNLQDLVKSVDIIPTVTSVKQFDLYLKRAVSNCYKYSFLICIVRKWNGLAGYIVHAESLFVFKTRLIIYLNIYCNLFSF